MAIDRYEVEPIPFGDGELIKVTLHYSSTQSITNSKKNFTRVLLMRIDNVSSLKLSALLWLIIDNIIKEGFARLQSSTIRWDRIVIENALESDTPVRFFKRINGVYGLRKEVCTPNNGFCFELYSSGSTVASKFYIRGVPNLYNFWDKIVEKPSSVSVLRAAYAKQRTELNTSKQKAESSRDEKQALVDAAKLEVPKKETEFEAVKNSDDSDVRTAAQTALDQEKEKVSTNENLVKKFVAELKALTVEFASLDGEEKYVEDHKSEIDESVAAWEQQQRVQKGLIGDVNAVEKALLSPGTKLLQLRVMLLVKDEPREVYSVEGVNVHTFKARQPAKTPPPKKPPARKRAPKK